MGHITSKSYYKLQQRLDKAPQGAPKSESLFKILKHLFTEKEAELISKLPIRPFTLNEAAKIWKISEQEAKQTINDLADKAIIVDLLRDNNTVYVIAPPMAGFIEWSIMKTNNHFNKKLLSELYYQYINNEDDFGKRVFSLNPPISRAYVQEDTIQEKDRDIVLDFEKVTELIKKTDAYAVGICYCRHKMEHLGKACKASMNVCMAFGDIAKSLIKHGVSKEISKKEALDIVKKCRDEGLVQIGSNMQNEISWLCNCCACCCEALIAYRKLGYNPRIETNWYANNDINKCTTCGICVKKCPVNAISIVKESQPKTCIECKTFAKVDMDRCIGCGVCTRFCPTKSLKIERRKETKFVPKDSFERSVLQAIDSGTLQNLIFDNYHLWEYGVFRAILGIIFKLPLAKWILANKQLQSRFLNAVGNYYYNKNPEIFQHIKPDYSHPELKKKY